MGGFRGDRPDVMGRPGQIEYSRWVVLGQIYWFPPAGPS